VTLGVTGDTTYGGQEAAETMAPMSYLTQALWPNRRAPSGSVEHVRQFLAQTSGGGRQFLEVALLLLKGFSLCSFVPPSLKGAP
jgi:hypothetical protein